jgi:hypothetical protein
MEVNMEVVVACCAGLDVHQASVVACLNQTAPNGRSRKQVRSFATMRERSRCVARLAAVAAAL